MQQPQQAIPAQQMRSIHIDSLMQKYNQTQRRTTAAAAGGEDAIDTYEVQNVKPRGIGPPLALTLKLPADFPSVPPAVTTLYGKEITGLKWSTDSRILLAELVEEAFARLEKLWGAAKPPEVSDFLPAVLQLPPQELELLGSDSQLLEVFVHDLAYAKKLRSETEALLMQIEQRAAENLDYEPRLKQLGEEIEELQKAASEHSSELNGVRDEAKLFAKYGTDDGLLRALKENVNALDESSAAEGDKFLEATAQQQQQQQHGFATSPTSAAGGGGGTAVSYDQYLAARIEYHRRAFQARAFGNSVHLI